MTGGIGIAEVEDAIAIDADGVGAVAVPVTHHRVIAWCTKLDSDVGSSIGVGIPEIEGGITRTECSDCIAARLVHFIEFAAGEIAIVDSSAAKLVAYIINNSIIIDHIQADRTIAAARVDRDRVGCT